MKNYPTFTIDPKSPFFETEVIKLLQYILKERGNDVNDFINLNSRFLLGRKSSKIPTGSLDIADTDRVGDMNYTPTYLYVVVDNSGSAEWRRVALSSW